MGILGLSTTDPQCGNSRQVNTGCMDSQILPRMYPQSVVSLPMPLLSISTLLPWSKLILNPVYTLSYIFLIPLMVMSPLYPFPFTSHPHPPFVPWFDTLPLPSSPAKSTLEFFNVYVLLLPCPVEKTNSRSWIMTPYTLRWSISCRLALMEIVCLSSSQ